MGERVSIITSLHNQGRNERDYISRMINNKVQCMDVALQYDYDYWDGDRKYGYGGYKYDGRWKSVAEELIKRYKLTDCSSVLDVGCGKAYLLYELKSLLPGLTIQGFDISEYSIKNAKNEIKDSLTVHNAKDPYPFKDNSFDLIISLGTLHNLSIGDLIFSISEINRVSINQYIMVEGYRNNSELFNLQCWALTCRSFYSDADWIWLFNHCNYSGDYEFIHFE